MENANKMGSVYPKTMIFMNREVEVNNFAEEQNIINMIKRQTGEMLSI